jgi:hypothetical protein
MCQACHGDASEHLKDPMKWKPDSPFKKGVPAEKQAAVCLTCHSGNRNLAFWTSGKHSLNDVACTNCHSIHGKTLAPTINKFVTTFLLDQADGCGTCHQQIRTATFKPSHHPIIEGKVSAPTATTRTARFHRRWSSSRRSTTNAIRAMRTSAARTSSTIRRSRRTARPATTRTARCTASC